MTLFLDLAPEPGGVGTFAVVAFFLLALAVAFIAFKMLKKTVKMAFRITVVAIILAVAVAGSIALWAIGNARPVRPIQPARVKTK